MHSLLPEFAQWLSAAAPFAGHTRKGDRGPRGPHGGDGPPPYTPDVRRVMETLIPAAIVGVIVLWGSVQVIGSDIEACKERMLRMEVIMDRMHSDLYGPRWDLGPRTELPPAGRQTLEMESWL